MLASRYRGAEMKPLREGAPSRLDPGQLAAATALTIDRGPAARPRLPGIRYAGPVPGRISCLATHPFPGYLRMVVGGTGDRTHFQNRCFEET